MGTFPEQREARNYRPGWRRLSAPEKARTVLVVISRRSVPPRVAYPCGCKLKKHVSIPSTCTCGATTYGKSVLSCWGRSTYDSPLHQAGLSLVNEVKRRKAAYGQRRSNHRGRPKSHGPCRYTVRITDGDQHHRMEQLYYEWCA